MPKYNLLWLLPLFLLEEKEEEKKRKEKKNQKGNRTKEQIRNKVEKEIEKKKNHTEVQVKLAVERENGIAMVKKKRAK
jgi:hypothetical protein